MPPPWRWLEIEPRNVSDGSKTKAAVCMTPRLRLAILAALLALLLSAAIVPFVREWHYISRTAWIDDPERPGRVKLIAVVFPIYLFYVAAGLGSFLGSWMALGSGEGLRLRSLLLFVVLTD